MHSAAAFDINPEITDVTIFGGCPRWPKDTKKRNEFPKLAETTMLRFGKSSYVHCIMLPSLGIPGSQPKNKLLRLWSYTMQISKL